MCDVVCAAEAQCGGIHAASVHCTIGFGSMIGLIPMRPPKYYPFYEDSDNCMGANSQCSLSAGRTLPLLAGKAGDNNNNNKQPM